MHISFYYGENDYHLDTFVILTDQTCAVSIMILLKTLLTSKPRWKAMEWWFPISKNLQPLRLNNMYIELKPAILQPKPFICCI